ncbi:MAG: 4Fe-4S dicluster domain-containing protein, partial [Dehalococcoidia bacterium]
MSPAIPDKETVDILREMGGDTLKICYQCGTCTGTCPWNLVRTFLPRRMMYRAQLGLIDFGDEDIWTCATCGACAIRCPRGVEMTDVIR